MTSFRILALATAAWLTVAGAAHGASPSSRASRTPAPIPMVAAGETIVFWAPASKTAAAPVVFRDAPVAAKRLKMDPKRVTVSNHGSRDAIQIRVPRGQAPGRYLVRLASATKSTTGAASPIAFQVLPFDLMGSSRGYAYVGRKLWGAETPAHVRISLLAQSQEIGFLRFGILASGTDLIETLATCRQSRLREPVLCRPVATELLTRAVEIESERRAMQLPAVQWVLTSEQWDGAEPLRASGVPCGILLKEGANLPEPPPSMQIFHAEVVLRDGKAGGIATASGTPSSTPGPVMRWWTWDAARSSEARNRLLAGFLLWRAEMAGAYLEEPEESPAADPAATRRRWEALRAGITDTRYLTTLYSLIRQCKDKDRRHPLPGQAEAALAQALARLTPDSPMSAADATRRLARDWIVRLRAVVG
jgi:hypothetical protein